MVVPNQMLRYIVPSLIGKGHLPLSNSYYLLEQKCKSIGIGTYLFVKLPRPGDSEKAFSVFESSCHLLQPV